VRLPGLDIHYTPPAITGLPTDRAALGLSNNAVVYLSCQSLFKYLPRHDVIWPRIAARVPTAQILFLASHNGAGDMIFRQRLERVFAQAGLDWRKHCIIVPRVPADGFSSLLRAGDLFLDSIGWSGCNSTLEAVDCGIPVVTKPTGLMRGRHSAAILACMGMADRVAADEDDYVEQAVQLANVEARAEFAAQLGRRKSRVFRDTAPIRALEKFLEGATRNHDNKART
jgi:predicted O-linked N-acetylglucosamine transferase (SPINDLY family)